MKNFVLKDISILSHREKRARKIHFHPQTTVIRGDNDTGKSSIIKSIYYTLGAEPPVIHRLWKEASVITVVSFEVDSVPYTVLRAGATFVLSDAAGERLGRFTSVTNELGPGLAELFDFYVRLKGRKQEEAIPTPAFLFLPYYIDQDSGWGKTWSSFARLQQFSNWKTDLVYYHTGIRPNEYYALRSESRDIELAREEPVSKHRVLTQLSQDLIRNLAKAKFDVDIDSFKEEINSLLQKCATLKEQEEKYRSKLVTLETERHRLEAQREIVQRVRRELNTDYEFVSRDLTENEVECPTCGERYENSFAERFAIAQDEDRCRSLLLELAGDMHKNVAQIDEHRATLTRTSGDLETIQEILDERQGDVTLKTLIENEGKREMASQLYHRIEVLTSTIANLDAKLAELKSSMKRLEDPKRKQRIVAFYRDRMGQYLHKLRVKNLAEKVYQRIDASIPESGSDLPRALLAYSFALLHTIREFGSSTYCPLVIDSPNQQDQDAENHPRVLEFIRDERPLDTQLILGLVDDCAIDFGGKVIVMDEKHYALRQDEYRSVSEEIASLEDSAYS
jgi:predicted  nucleic acid-binding Zn-ribbon protein